MYKEIANPFLTDVARLHLFRGVMAGTSIATKQGTFVIVNIEKHLSPVFLQPGVLDSSYYQPQLAQPIVRGDRSHIW